MKDVVLAMVIKMNLVLKLMNAVYVKGQEKFQGYKKQFLGNFNKLLHAQPVLAMALE